MTKNEKPKLVITYRRLDELHPDPNNVRIHPPEQIEELRASIREYGATKPIALKAGDIIGAGNGTYQAAKLEGYVEWPTITPDLTPEQWLAYAILDNKVPLGAKWDEKKLAVQLDVIAQVSGASIVALTAFSAKDLSRMGVRGFLQQGSTSTAPQLGGLQHRIIVECKDESEQAALIDKLTAQGLTVKPLTS